MVRKNTVEDFPLEDKRSIYIKGIFGFAEKCPLVNIPMSIFMGGKDVQVHQDFLCAVAPSLVEDVLLPPEIKDKLMGTFLPEATTHIEDNSCDECKESTKNVVIPEFAVVDQSLTNEACAAKVEETSSKGLTKTEKFLQEQTICEDLNEARKRAEEEKAGFYFENKFLFHKEKILGETVS